MNRPDKGALYWDNLAVQIATKKIYLLTRICDGQKRKKKKNFKKNIPTDALFGTQSPLFEEKKKKRKKIHIFK